MSSVAATAELDISRSGALQLAPLNLGRHLPALDGLRGIAVLLVVTTHYFSPLYTGDTFASKLVYKLTHFGWCGVDLFFVLSGFLITGILCDSKASPQYFRTFYLRRTLRIFPLYYAVLFVAFVLLPRVSVPSAADIAVAEHQRSLWLYYTNITTAVYGWVQNGDRLNMTALEGLKIRG